METPEICRQPLCYALIGKTKLNLHRYRTDHDRFWSLWLTPILGVILGPFSDAPFSLFL